MNIKSIKTAIKLINNKLILEEYDDSCKCRICDALRPFARAKDLLEEEIGKEILGQNPSSEGKAQTRSQEVGDRSRTLAVAQPTEVSGVRYKLWVNGHVIFIGWANEVMALARRNKFDITFL